MTDDRRQKAEDRLRIEERRKARGTGRKAIKVSWLRRHYEIGYDVDKLYLSDAWSDIYLLNPM
jgi:hypothetical protein